MPEPKMVKQKPERTILNGLFGCKKAFAKEFRMIKGPRTGHISYINQTGGMNKNIMRGFVGRKGKGLKNWRR